MRLMVMAENEDGLDGSDLADEVQSFRLIVSQLPDSVFTAGPSKDEFERQFLAFGVMAVFEYLGSFRRVRVCYMKESQADAARQALHGTAFEERKMSVHRGSSSSILAKVFKSGNSLKPPKAERTELISPPSSPPVGWVQAVEAPPVVDFEMKAAVASLAEAGSTVELFTGDTSLPSINVVVCD